MKRVCFTLLAICLVIVMAGPIVAQAKYASYDATERYLSWAGAKALARVIDSEAATQTSPHGGYTQTSVKCAVCHSIHRATYQESAGTLVDNQLRDPQGGACVACHATWGTTPSARLIEVGTLSSGPHMGAGGDGCNNNGCHGNPHGSGLQSKYAIVRAYNLNNKTNPLDAQMDIAIADGNIVKNSGTSEPATTTNTSDGTTQTVIGTKSLDQAMKSYVTGYVCYPCHGKASRSVANAEYSTISSGTVGVTGHLSTGSSKERWIPTCEGCHDLVGVATNSTAWPHANRGIAVYTGRFVASSQTVTVTAQIATDNTDATRYGLWMTSANYGADAQAVPLVGAVANSKSDFTDGTDTTPSTAQTRITTMLTDGACVKCHPSNSLR